MCKRLIFLAFLFIAFGIAGTMDYEDQQQAVCDTDSNCEAYEFLKPTGIKSVLTDDKGHTIYSWEK